MKVCIELVTVPGQKGFFQSPRSIAQSGTYLAKDEENEELGVGE